MQTLKLVLIVAALTAIWCQECGETTNGRRGIFNLLGKGFHQIESDCFSGQLGHPVLGARKRVARIPMASSRGNPQLFCNQNAYVPFGAQCNRDLSENEEVSIAIFETDVQLQLFLGKFSSLNSNWETIFCQENLQRQQLSLALEDSLRNGQILIAEYIVIQTHSSLKESFCDAELTGDFLQAVRNLPDSAETPADRLLYNEFFRDFGISVVNQVRMGGVAIKFSSVNRNFIPRSVEVFASDVNVTYYGGDSAAIRDSNRKYGLWIETVFDHPITLSVGAVKISDIFNPNLFSSDDTASLILAKAQIIDDILQNLIPGDFELMFSDGSTGQFLVGQHAFAPEGLWVVNFRFLTREYFQSLFAVSFYKPGGDRSVSTVGDISLIDSIIGEWIDQDLEDRDQILDLYFVQDSALYEDLLVFTMENSEAVTRNIFRAGSHSRIIYHQNGMEPMKDMSFEFINNTPALPISNYDIKVKWSDLKITYHNFNDVIARESIPNQQASIIFDLVILQERSSLFQLRIKTTFFSFAYIYAEQSTSFYMDRHSQMGTDVTYEIHLIFPVGIRAFDIQYIQDGTTYGSEKYVYNYGDDYDGYKIVSDKFTSIKISQNTDLPK